MKKTILFTAPYMIPFVNRFKPVFYQYRIELIVPDVQERMEEADLLQYAGQFDGAIRGMTVLPRRTLKRARLRMIAKWGTGRCNRRVSLFPPFG